MNLYEFITRLFTLDAGDTFKTFAQVISILGGILAIGTILITRTLPWWRAKCDSRSVAKTIGAELFTPDNIERSLKYYIHPLCQDIDPAGGEEPRLVYGVKQKLFDALDDALNNQSEYRYLFLLADSGMGKTSALLNYYARYLHRRNKQYDLILIPLGIPDADKRISEIKSKPNTILFLDAFDEDTLAIVDHVERLRLLLKATSEFRRVLISCRTQFFSKDEEVPKRTGLLKVGSRAAGEPAEYFFHKIYLSPFSEKQVFTYLRQRYPIWKLWKMSTRLRAREMVEKIPHLTDRPMLLAHIDDLVLAKREFKYSFELYEEMIEAWLKREQGFIQETEDLRRFSERLAFELYRNRAERGTERMAKPDLLNLAAKWNIPLDDWKLTGRSLLNRDSDGNYKFAHRSIMEYLFVKHYLDGERRCLEVAWTDQMRRLFCEMIENHISALGGLDANTLGKVLTYCSTLLDPVNINDIRIALLKVNGRPIQWDAQDKLEVSNRILKFVAVHPQIELNSLRAYSSNEFHFNLKKEPNLSNSDFVTSMAKHIGYVVSKWTMSFSPDSQAFKIIQLSDSSNCIKGFFIVHSSQRNALTDGTSERLDDIMNVLARHL